MAVTLRRILGRLQYLLRSRTVEADLREELETHRAHLQTRFEQSGMSPADAQRASRRALGNMTLAREDAREVWIWPFVERLWQDARCGSRILQRQPTFAATALLTLSIGIGATMAVFCVVESELWTPLPFPEAHRLVGLFTTGSGISSSQEPVSGPDFLDWRSQTRSFEPLAAFRWTGRRILRGRGAPESVRVMPVTSNFFAALRRTPARGRAFGPEDEASGGAVILTDAAWRRLFDADPDIVGGTVRLDDQPYGVAGIMAAGARLEFVADPDLFVVLDLKAIGAGDRSTRDLVPVARLADGVGLGKANADLRTVAVRLARDYPAEHAGRGAWVGDLRKTYTGWNWRPLIFFLGAAVFVLLLSCANVANLLLARSIGRQREFAIRGALGGGRGALARQLLVEGALLAIPAAGIGMLLAAWALRALPAWLPPDYLGRGAPLVLDARAYLCALAAAALTTIAFGLTPAPFVVRRDLSGALSQGGRIVAGSPGQQRARHALVVLEVTMALVLVVGAGLFLNSYVRLTHLPLGFDPRDRLLMRIPLTGARYADRDEVVRFSERLTAEAQAVPGVRDAAVGTEGPLGSGPVAFFARADRPRPGSGEELRSVVRAISPEFFRVHAIRRLAGRDFTAADASRTPRVAVINENLARLVFPGENPAGKELVLVRASSPWITSGSVLIVGVVSNIKDVGMNEVDFNDIYLPIAQCPVTSLQLVVSTAIPPDDVAEALRRKIYELDGDIPVHNMTTMTQRVDEALRGYRFHSVLIGAFAGLAVLLASVGVFGAMSYAIEQRTREFGLRLALGAQRSGILALAMRQSGRLAVIGTVLGLGISLALARILGDALYLVAGKHGGLLYGVRTTDPPTLIGAAVMLLGVATLAGFVPARRAIRVDPVVALRCD